MNDRIRTYIERAPEAISGQGGHNTTLRVARTLYNGFALSRDQVLEWLQVYNSRLSDRWTARELEHKADSAAGGRFDKPRGWMLGRGSSEPRRIVIQPAKNANCAWKPAKKYVLATDAMDVFYSQSTMHARTRAHARSGGESEIAVASVAGASKKPEALPLAPAIPGSEPPAIEKLTAQTHVQPFGSPPVETPEDIEANRIADELRKLNGAGTLKGADDPEAAFYACLIRGFGATLLPEGTKEAPVAVLPEGRWDAKLLTGYSQPRTRGEHTAFLMAAFEPRDVFDFSNPDAVAEFNKLYRRSK